MFPKRSQQAASIINIFLLLYVILISAAALYNLDKVKKAVSGPASNEEAERGRMEGR